MYSVSNIIIVVDLFAPVVFNIFYTVPAPASIVINRSRSGVLYEGTTFNLICVITPDTSGVDTEFSVNSSVLGPRTSDVERIIISQPVENGEVYETNVRFRALRRNDGGTYNCSSRATSTLRYVSASEPADGSTTIFIDGEVLCGFL